LLAGLVVLIALLATLARLLRLLTERLILTALLLAGLLILISTLLLVLAALFLIVHGNTSFAVTLNLRQRPVLTVCSALTNSFSFLIASYSFDFHGASVTRRDAK
jgi:hypothetical protein